MMNIDNYWEQIKKLRPSLASHTNIQRRDYAGELWFIIEDKNKNRFHRMTPEAMSLISSMNGLRNLDQVLIDSKKNTFTNIKDSSSENDSNQEYDNDDKENLIHLIQYLHVADLIVCDQLANAKYLIQRKEKNNKLKWKRLILNPVTWNIKLFNPEPLLNKLTRPAQLIFSKFGFIIWLITISSGIFFSVIHWQELSNQKLERLLSPQNLLLLWLIYPTLKLLHELGHALACKAWGGQTPTFGIVFILGTPLPYIDASSATGFDKKSQRLIVSMAGIAVELFIASLAILLWPQVNQGIVKDILFNIILIGAVATLIFNLNPLIRFDGYHFLCDLLDEPNLASRAKRKLQSLCRSVFYLKGLKEIKEYAHWISLYPILAFIYRITILISLVYIAANHFPKLALILGLWFITFQLLWPILKTIYATIETIKEQPYLLKRSLPCLAILSMLIACFFFLPLKQSTRTEGIVWLDDKNMVKIEADGQFFSEKIKNGQSVQKGQLLVQLQNETIETEIETLKEEIVEFTIKLNTAWSENRAIASTISSELKRLQTELKELKNKHEKLQVISSEQGIYRRIDEQPLVGRHFNAGETIATITNKETKAKIKAVLNQDQVGLIRNSLESIELRFSYQPNTLISASIEEGLSSPTKELPSAALSTAGGGAFEIDSSDQNAKQLVHTAFIVDLNTDAAIPQAYYGARAYITFNHKAASAYQQLSRLVRSQLLETFE
ncbi:hypothetical protein [Agaribacterium sp. ZY112]|uniref:hypothetical protein n=1 Tax=Agaribacterium sp. ZY112 TaxID=3233574 RepID=UPI0035261E4E